MKIGQYYNCEGFCAVLLLQLIGVILLFPDKLKEKYSQAIPLKTGMFMYM